MSKAERVKKEQENHKEFEIPFNSENKWMVTIHGVWPVGKFNMIMKGAPDYVLKYCTFGRATASSQKEKVLAKLEELMGQGRRVLCVARRDLSGRDLPAGQKFEGTGPKDC